MSNKKDNRDQLQPVTTDANPPSVTENGDSVDAVVSEPKALAGIGSEDRDGKGRFRKGWKGGPGCPKAYATRKALRERINDGLVKEALDTASQVMRDAKARAADRLRAAELIVTWRHGLPVASDVLQTIDELEARLKEVAEASPPQEPTAYEIPAVAPVPPPKPAPAPKPSAPEPQREPPVPFAVANARERMLQETAAAN